MIFIGYDTGSKGYIFMKNNNTLVKAPQATWHEKWFPTYKSESDENKSNKSVQSKPENKPKRLSDGDVDSPHNSLDPFDPSNIPFSTCDENDYQSDQPNNFDDLPNDEGHPTNQHWRSPSYSPLPEDNNRPPTPPEPNPFSY